MPEKQEKGPERVAFYLTFILALVVTTISIWIVLPEHLSLTQLIVTAISTFVSILGAESFLQRMWKPFDRAFSHREQANAQHGTAMRRSITARFSITILLTSFTLSLLLSGLLSLIVFTKILSNTIGIYRVLIFVGIFFLSYSFSLLCSSLVLEYRLRPGRVRRLFVNRTVEMQRLLYLVPSLDEVVWAQIYGIQGIGKTKLLQEFKYQVLKKWDTQHFSWHELRCFPRDHEKRDWETLLRDTYKFKYDTAHTVQEQFLSTIPKSAVIAIDDFPYHNAPFVKGFLGTLILLAHNHKSILIVTTARERVKFDSTHLPSDIKVLEPTALNPLDSEAIGQYVHGFERVYPAKYKSNKEIYDDIYRERTNVQTIAYGHPYTIDNILNSPELWTGVKSKPDRVVDINDLCRNMCASFSVSLLDALQTVAVVAKHTRDWSEETLVGVINNEAICAELLEKNLAYQIGDSYRMHDIMQSYIYEELVKSGEHYEVHQTVAAFYEQKTQDEDASILALKHYLSARDSSGTKRVHKKAIERSNFIGNFTESIQLGELSLDLVKGQTKTLSTLPREDQRVIVDLLLLQSYASKVQGKYPSALAILAQCDDLLRPQRKRDQQLQVRVHTERANIYRLQGRFREAVPELEAAQRFAQALKDEAGLADINYGIARVARLQGDLNRAVSHYETALSIFTGLGLQDKQAWAFFALGEVYRLQGNLEQSSKEYERALKQFQHIRNKEGESYAAWGVGEILRIRGDFPGAHEQYAKSQRLCQETGDLRSEGWAVMGIAETLRMEHKFQYALATYKEALTKVCSPDTNYEDLIEQLVMQEEQGVERCHIALGIASTLRLLKRVKETDYQPMLQFYEKRAMKQCMVHVLIDVALSCLGNEQKVQSYLEHARQICAEKSYTAEAQLIEAIETANGDYQLHPLNFP